MWNQFKVNNKRSERHQWRCSGVIIVNFEHFFHIVLVFILLTLSLSMSGINLWTRFLGNFFICWRNCGGYAGTFLKIFNKQVLCIAQVELIFYKTSKNNSKLFSINLTFILFIHWRYVMLSKQSVITILVVVYLMLQLTFHKRSSRKGKICVINCRINRWLTEANKRHYNFNAIRIQLA